MALREALRAGTAREHRDLESLLGLERPHLVVGSYLEYLRLTHAFYARIEPCLAASPELEALGLDMRGRAKVAWLEEDLAFFGTRPVEGLPAVPDTSDGSAALGCAYVLEGATLGGGVLSRSLAPRLGIGPGRGATFLAGYGERSGAMWRGFLGALDRAAWAGIDEAACVEAARRTFTSLGAWFRTRGWPSH